MENDIQVGDVVQAMRGLDRPSFGVVMDIQRGHYVCWMRSPTDEGGKNITFRLRHGDCVWIGKAKMRPLRKGEAPQQPPLPTTTKAQPVLPARETVTPSVASPIEKAAQAGADLHAPQPEDVDPAMLQTAVFRGPSAYEAHNLTPPPPRMPNVPPPLANRDAAQLTSDPLAPPVKRKRSVRMKKRRGVK